MEVVRLFVVPVGVLHFLHCYSVLDALWLSNPASPFTELRATMNGYDRCFGALVLQL